MMEICRELTFSIYTASAFVTILCGVESRFRKRFGFLPVSLLVGILPSDVPALTKPHLLSFNVHKPRANHQSSWGGSNASYDMDGRGLCGPRRPYGMLRGG